MVPTTDPKKKKEKKPAYTVKSLLNPKNWGVSDYSDRENFNQAFGDAKKDEQKEFMFEGSRYNTKSDTTPQAQLNKYGITDDQREAKTILSERLYKSIRPDDYGEGEFAVKLRDFLTGADRFDENRIHNKTQQSMKANEEANDILLESITLQETNPEMAQKLIGATNKLADKLQDKSASLLSNLGEDDPQSEDGWRMYLGLPQKNSTFDISKYKPGKSKDKNSLYYSLPQEFKDSILKSYKEGRFLVDEQTNSEGINERSISSVSGDAGRVLGNFTVGKGKDDKGEYISYYDKYDLHPNSGSLAGQFDADKLTGKPFEIYDRVYLNEKPKKKRGGKLIGPSHEQGGIDAKIDGKVVANVEGGERLFSINDNNMIENMIDEMGTKPSTNKAAKLGKKVAKMVKTQDAVQKAEEMSKKFNTFNTDPEDSQEYMETFR